MASYAQEIESRVIHTDCVSYSRNVGRLRLHPLYDNRHRIGSAVSFKVRSRRDNMDSTNADWIFRVYVDGMAYLYSNKLPFRYVTNNAIMNTIMKYFNLVRVIQADSYRDTLTVLRRKPVGKVYRKTTLNAYDFNDFLQNKYNIKAGAE